MSNHKRKVTDLLPSEAIRVSPSQDGRVFDIEPIPTESDEVEVDNIRPFDVYPYLNDEYIIYTTERDDMGESLMCANIVTRSRLIEIAENIQSILTRNTPNQ